VFSIARRCEAAASLLGLVVCCVVIGGGTLATASGVSAQEVVHRPFLMGINTVPYDSYHFYTSGGISTPLTPGFEHTLNLLENHADLVSHSFQDGVPWPEALNSSDYRDYSRDLQQFWEMLRAVDESRLPGHQRYIVLNPINSIGFTELAPYWGQTPRMALPAPWDGYDFNHPDVKQAYLNYVIAVIKFFQPKYLAINMEANILLARAPSRWTAFKELNAYIYDQVKLRYPNVVVFSSIQYEHMLGLHSWSHDLAEAVKTDYPNVLENEVSLLLQHSDLMALSTFPYMVQGNIVGADYFARAYAVASAAGIPVAIDQTGYISEDYLYAPLNTLLPGSEALQNDFTGFLLVQALLGRFVFVINFIGVDYGTQFGTNPADLTWATAGLVRTDGTPKPALTTWGAFFDLPYAGDP